MPAPATVSKETHSVRIVEGLRGALLAPFARLQAQPRTSSPPRLE